MTGPPSTRQPTDDRSVVRTVVDSTLGDPLAIVAGAVVFLTGALTTVFAMQRVLWDGLRNDLNKVTNVDGVICVTPFDVIFLQVRAALLVGFILALETLVFRRWWTRSSLSSPVCLFLALVGAALFPVGAVLGYEYAFPVIFETLGAGDSTWSVVELVGLACYVSIATGVVAQIAFAVGVLKHPPFGVDGTDAGES